jgi:rRNA processing protein Gar1
LLPLEYGVFVHPSEEEMVFKVLNVDQIPKFNAPVFLANKTVFGTIDEIFGPVNEVVRFPEPSFDLLSMK